MERVKWPGLALLLGGLGMLLRRWHLASAFEGDNGLLVAGAPANRAMIAFLVLCAAAFLLLARTAPCRLGGEKRLSHWDLVFAAEGDRGYMTLMVMAAMFTLAATPLLMREAARLIAIRRATGGGDNGMLQVVLALCALFSCACLVVSARDAYRMKGRGREKESLLLPAAMGCVWLLEAYRANAPDPVLWNYVPLLLAAAAGVLFYLECAGLSYDKGHPRLVLWLAAMTVVLSAVALAGKPPLSMAALLIGQLLAALAALWTAPKNLASPPGADRFGLRARLRLGLSIHEEDKFVEPEEKKYEAQEIQEEDNHV